MSNGNPFYVHPGTDFGPGLMGLAQTVERVGVRKKAEEKLKKKIEELERFEKVTVDRELQMVKLKKKIKELEEELKNK